MAVARGHGFPQQGSRAMWVPSVHGSQTVPRAIGSTNDDRGKNCPIFHRLLHSASC